MSISEIDFIEIDCPVCDDEIEVWGLNICQHKWECTEVECQCGAKFTVMAVADIKIKPIKPK